jgi:hypothetical protein
MWRVWTNNRDGPTTLQIAAPNSIQLYVGEILWHARVFTSVGVCVQVEGVSTDFEEIEHKASDQRGRYTIEQRFQQLLVKRVWLEHAWWKMLIDSPWDMAVKPSD